MVLLDQSRLPENEVFLFVTDWRQVIEAINTLKVRGAPAIGIAGAALMTLRAAEFVFATQDTPSDEEDFDRVFVIDKQAQDVELYKIGLEYAAEMALKTRPTAVSLQKALKACLDLIHEEIETCQEISVIANRLYEFTSNLIIEDENRNRMIGFNGAKLLKDNSTILTHCNAGSLATAYFGTALGIVYTAFDQGKLKHVFIDETRPVCQGSRLSAWELSRAGVSGTLICDDMAASVMSQGKIDAVIVGADRIAANGDVANKIGTCGVAIMANYFNIPFYVAAPNETIDVNTKNGAQIPIEQRNESEISKTPLEGIEIYNPAFDVTPSNLITAIITETGVYKPQDILLALKEDIS